MVHQVQISKVTIGPHNLLLLIHLQTAEYDGCNTEIEMFSIHIDFIELVRGSKAEDFHVFAEHLSAFKSALKRRRTSKAQVKLDRAKNKKWMLLHKLLSRREQEVPSH